MTGIQRRIQRHLEDECKRPEINFFSPNDHIFASFRATLDAVMKERTAEGMGVVKHTENLTVDEETELWKKGVINKLTPKGLSYGIFFYNCKVFGLRGLSEHKQLQAEQFVVNTSNAGDSKITFSEFRSKTVKGGGGVKRKKLCTPSCNKAQ